MASSVGRIESPVESGKGRHVQYPVQQGTMLEQRVPNRAARDTCTRSLLSRPRWRRRLCSTPDLHHLDCSRHIVKTALFGTSCSGVQAGSCGGIAATLRAMAGFPRDADLQGHACTTITNLSHNCDRNRRQVVEGGGLILILDAMQVSQHLVRG